MYILTHAAHHLETLGYGERLRPLLPGRKYSALKKDEKVTRAKLMELLSNDFNLGIALGKEADGHQLMIVDCDTPKAEQWAQEHGCSSPMVSITSRGIHLYMRHLLGTPKNVVNHLGIGLDLIFHGIAPVQPSWIEKTEHRMLWKRGVLRIEDLPVFNGALLPAVPTRAYVLPGVDAPGQGKIRNPEAYAMRIESVQGAYGSKALVRVVCVLRDAGWSAARAYEFLGTKWNPVCAKPPWSEADIVRCIQRHFGLD